MVVGVNRIPQARAIVGALTSRTCGQPCFGTPFLSRTSNHLDSPFVTGGQPWTEIYRRIHACSDNTLLERNIDEFARLIRLGS